VRTTGSADQYARFCGVHYLLIFDWPPHSSGATSAIVCENVQRWPARSSKTLQGGIERFSRMLEVAKR
jgi:hypothetical protein